MNIIDLTRRIEDDMAVFPGHPPVRVTRHFIAEMDGRNVENICMGSHAGTHVDVPYHFICKGLSSENISLPSICGTVMLLDVTFKNGEPITVWDLEDKEEDIKSIKKLIFQTNWSQTESAYYKDYPTLSLDACKWLCNLNIEMIGMDTPSPGAYGKKGNDIHKLLLDHNIYIIEGLTNLNQIGVDKFLFICLPLYVEGTGGVPCRAIALKDG